VKNTKYAAKRLTTSMLLLVGKPGHDFSAKTRHQLTLEANGENYNDIIKHHIGSMELIAALVPTKSVEDAMDSTAGGDDHELQQASLRILHLIDIATIAASLSPICSEQWPEESLVCVRRQAKPHLDLIRAHAEILQLGSGSE
jgi:hypothetical protein